MISQISARGFARFLISCTVLLVGVPNFGNGGPINVSITSFCDCNDFRREGAFSKVTATCVNRALIRVCASGWVACSNIHYEMGTRRIASARWRITVPPSGSVIEWCIELVGCTSLYV